MTISMQRLLKHMAWANQETIKHLQSLPPESLKAYATNPEWFVGEILHHIVEAADNYVFRISGERPEGITGNIQEIEKPEDLEKLASQLSVLDAALLNCEKLEDIQLEYTNYSGSKVKRWRSTILSQSIHHATEHRAQIASALEAKGFAPLALDDLDVWSYEIENG